ncbi:MAG TPA: flagellar biosynthetic protein FliR [Candidatus Baltobacteraceae bacterium]|nr:flagellar biosynthetic protein FliR [Candidatus Baltobacteraceae bacterium]
MTELFHISQGQFETFLLIVVRVSSMLFVFPVFSSQQIPVLARIGLAFLFGFILMHTVPAIAPLGDIGALLAAVVSQVVLGILVGFVAYLVFMGIQFAGEILDIQIGFAVANVINPTTQQQVTVIGELQLTLATLVFLMSDSHLVMLQGIGGSFHLLPLPYINLNPAILGNVMGFVQDSFLIVVKIAAPPAVALFLVNLALGLMARVAPQMNVFVVGFPLQVGVGLLMMAVSLPLLGYVGPPLFHSSADQMDTLMRGLHP